jgi:hypothetical protein
MTTEAQQTVKRRWLYARSMWRLAKARNYCPFLIEDRRLAMKMWAGAMIYEKQT